MKELKLNQKEVGAILEWFMYFETETLPVDWENDPECKRHKDVLEKLMEFDQG